MTEPIDPAAVMAKHPGDVRGDDWSWCHQCRAEWPCEPYRLASALFAEQAKVARVVELAHRFEIVPRARLLGALTAKAKP